MLENISMIYILIKINKQDFFHCYHWEIKAEKDMGREKWIKMRERNRKKEKRNKLVKERRVEERRDKQGIEKMIIEREKIWKEKKI